MSLANIKKLLDKKFDERDKIIHGLSLQLSAVENKISELENIRLTLKQSINNTLILQTNNDCNQCFNKIIKSLNENKENKKKWIDKWGFDSWAKNYDNSIKYNSWDELNIFEKYDYVLEVVARKILDVNALKVIDFGCGTANLYGKLNNNIDYIGVDQSIDMLLQAKNKISTINLRLGNFLDEPITHIKFDVVISTYAFHHLNALEKEKAINLLLNYLKPDGRIIIADLMFLNKSERIKQKDYFYKQNRKDLWDEIEDEYYMDIEEIKKYAEFLGCIVQYEHIVNFTWIVEIVKYDA